MLKSQVHILNILNLSERSFNVCNISTLTQISKITKKKKKEEVVETSSHKDGSQLPIFKVWNDFLYPDQFPTAICECAHTTKKA